MNTQHHTTIAISILGSVQRLFRPRKGTSLLATNHLDAHTMRDIGFNPVGKH